VLPEREGLVLEGNSWNGDEGSLSSVEAEWVSACERERLGYVQPREGRSSEEGGCELVGVGVAAALAEGKGKLWAAAWFSEGRVQPLFCGGWGKGGLFGWFGW
jgi:hypothetical protein